MKKMSTLAIAAALAAAFSAGNAHAAEGSIAFNGNVVASTCAIDVNGQGANGSLTLDTVSWSDLDEVGAVAGETPFTITLEGCNFGADGELAIRPEFAQTNVNPATGNLMNVDGGLAAADIEVQIVNAEMMPINLTTNENNDYVATDDTVAFDYYARYVRAQMGGEAFGSVNTALMFSVQYQ